MFLQLSRCYLPTGDLLYNHVRCSVYFHACITIYWFLQTYAFETCVSPNRVIFFSVEKKIARYNFSAMPLIMEPIEGNALLTISFYPFFHPVLLNCIIFLLNFTLAANYFPFFLLSNMLILCYIRCVSIVTAQNLFPQYFLCETISTKLLESREIFLWYFLIAILGKYYIQPFFNYTNI